MFKKEKNRYEILDQLKAVAVVMMIYFHLFYDLDLFKVYDTDRRALFWKIQPKIIISIFLICMGMNLSLVHKKTIRWKSLIKRSFKLLCLALGITTATYFIFPKDFIYFGILHFICVASFVSLPFIRYPTISLMTGIGVIIPSLFYGYKYPFIKFSRSPVDHVPLLPWLGCVLIGFFLFHVGAHKIAVPDYKGKVWVSLLGKYSLEIYILHQVILFPICYALSLLLN